MPGSDKTQMYKIKNDDNFETTESSESSSDENDVMQNLNQREYNKFLYKLFPSRFTKQKMNTDDDDKPSKKKKKEKEKEKEKEKKKEKGKEKKKYSRDKLRKKSKSKKKMKESESESESNSESEMEYDSDCSEKKPEYNIILSVGPTNNGRSHSDMLYYDDEYDGDYDDEYDEYDEDYTDEEYLEEEEEEEESDEEFEEEIASNDSDDDSSKEKSKRSTRSPKAVCNKEIIRKFESIVKNLSPEEQKNELVQSMKKFVKSENQKQADKEKKKTKKERMKNTNKFRKLQRDNNMMNDLRYFQENLTVEEQQIALKQMKEIKKHSHVEKPYKLALLDTDIPASYKAFAMNKINSLRYMEPGEGEYYKVKNWVDAFMQIPFGKYRELPITIDDGIDKCNKFMEDAKKTLDDAVYGLNDAKMQVLQMVGQWIANPKSVGTAIAIKGPMGTGKTTLVKEGISKVLNKAFKFIALGGAVDSSDFNGHSYTYEGSTWGKIVQTLIQCKSMNPVIYFDELDKISDTPKGEEIVGILTHLTDITQNSCFHDKFFAEIDFDLSRCLFIFSYNNEENIKWEIKKI